MDRASLTRFAWLSIAAAIATMGLKTLAWALTGSVGLLSDAVESVVNLAGGIMALWMLTVAAKPADEDHLYGHSKAEYFASVFEGALILIAAIAIGIAAVHRLLYPHDLEKAGLGLAVTGLAAILNLVVARILLRAGKAHRSITLEADGRHLMTDVWTSAGVIVGVGAVALTGFRVLDPLIALAVAANIVWSGFTLVSRSVRGFMDTALPPEEGAAVRNILDSYAGEGVQYHALRTRQAGAHRFVAVHILVPGDWSVQRGHDLLERIEAEIREELGSVTITTHLEPAEDAASMADMDLHRHEIAPGKTGR